MLAGLTKYTLSIMPRGDEHFDEYVRSRTVRPPKVLYKYTTVETARIILATGKLRFQSPVRYNDPFDSQWDLAWPAFTPEARQYERRLIEQALLDPAAWPTEADPVMRHAMDQERARIEALPPEERDHAIAEFVLEVHSSGKPPEPLAQRLSDIRRRLRVLCLSERDCSILMWSHYADQHRGVTLGFDSAAMENGFRRPLEQVVYQDGPPRLFDPEVWHRSMIFGLDWEWEPTGLELVLTKQTDWKYEREWRFATIASPGTLGDYEDILFPRASLVEILVGCRTDETQAAELQTLADVCNPEVRYFRMSIDASQFQVVRTEVPSPGAC
ncbi:MAG: DUF2971 domain-containing protein [Planctomycetota bacterium]